jgi:hypothetical protein
LNPANDLHPNGSACSFGHSTIRQRELQSSLEGASAAIAPERIGLMFIGLCPR